MFNNRTVPVYRKFHEMVTSGEVGPMTRNVRHVTTWFRSQSYYDSGGWRATWAGEGGGVLLNQCPHDLDLWQWICGMPRRVRAFCGFGKYHRIEVEDDVTAYVEYESGATGVFITSTSESPGTNRWEVSGDNGKLLLENGHITFWRTRVPITQFHKEYTGGFGQPECWKCEIPVKGGGGKHLEVTSDFVSAITKGTPLVAKGEDGIRSLELSNAMLLSAWTDSWVDLPMDEDLFHAKLQERIDTSTFKKAVDDKTMDVKTSFGSH
jgi:predicted dehydrogenase